MKKILASVVALAVVVGAGFYTYNTKEVTESKVETTPAMVVVDTPEESPEEVVIETPDFTPEVEETQIPSRDIVKRVVVKESTVPRVKFSKTLPERQKTSVPTIKVVYSKPEKEVPVVEDPVVDTSEYINLSINENGSNVLSCKVEIKEGGENLRSVMHRVAESIDMQMTDNGGYISKMNGRSAYGMTGWVYEKNGVVPNVGISGQVINDGDTISWNYGDHRDLILR